MEIVEIKIGDVIKFKKPHPCGSYEWIVRRIGIDFKLECKKCGHIIMLARLDVEKRLKK